MSEKDEHLSVVDAYRAMLVFLDQLQDLTGSDDLAGLLDGLQLASDGGTIDPAAWDDWLNAIKEVRAKRE